MNEAGISLQVIDEIVSLAQKHNIEKVVLFGSRARGDYHRASDIDLAVYGGDIVNFSFSLHKISSIQSASNTDGVPPPIKIVSTIY